MASVDGYLSSFNSVCTEILDKIAPLKYRKKQKTITAVDK